jgi:chromosome segregation ATPase
MTTPNDDYNGVYEEIHFPVSPERQALPEDVSSLKKLVARYAHGYKMASERVRTLELENTTLRSQRHISNMKTIEKLVIGNVQVQGDFLHWKSAAEQEISILQDHISTQSEETLQLQQEMEQYKQEISILQDHISAQLEATLQLQQEQEQYKVANEIQAKTIAQLSKKREQSEATLQLQQEREQYKVANEIQAKTIAELSKKREQSEATLQLQQEREQYKVANEIQAKIIAELSKKRERHTMTITKLLDERKRICGENEDLKRRLGHEEATGRESWSMLESFLQENVP